MNSTPAASRAATSLDAVDPRGTAFPASKFAIVRAEMPLALASWGRLQSSKARAARHCAAESAFFMRNTLPEVHHRRSFGSFRNFEAAGLGSGSSVTQPHHKPDDGEGNGWRR